MLRAIRFVACAALLFAAVLVAGCGFPTPPAAEPAAKSPAAAEGEHGHKPGAHGGLIVPIGRDRYHAEAVFEKGGALTLYTLDQDETKILEAPVQKVQAYARPEGGAESLPFTLEAKPLDGDGPGATSRFVGTLPEAARGRRVEVTLQGVRIGKERFRVSFSSPAPHTPAGVPAKVKKDKEKVLYLTPGGLYTAADIRKNGNRTASEKFAGFDAAHDLEPKPGDAVCPVTLTKASAECSWVVGGKTYTFCCPPCVDEFVRRAKEKPETVGPPESYRKK
jgi:YHS domain-containing protein